LNKIKSNFIKKFFNLLDKDVEVKIEIEKELMPELLLHPNIPKPLHGISPRVIKGREWWDKVRKEAYQKKDFICWACGVHKSKALFHQWLEAHETYEYNYEIGQLNFKGICALCHSCHNYIHSGRMMMLVEEGKMSEEKMNIILAHGENVLKLAGFSKFRSELPEKTKPVKWNEWHMIIDGKKYYSCFSSYEEWFKHYSINNGEGNLSPRTEP